MTPEERDVLLPLLDKIRQTRLPDKDAEVDQYIHQLVQAQPDAPYILAQTVLMQDYALHQAQARIQALEAQGSQTQQSGGGGSFLGGLFGGGTRTSAPAQGPWGSVPQSPYAQPMTNAVQGGGQPSFLRSAAQTAVGVAGASLLMDGMMSLFGGHGGFGGGMMGGGMMGGGFGAGSGMVDSGNTEVVNNYYDTPAPDQSAGVDNSDYSNADFDTSGSDFSGDDSFGI
jgi:hypothetical protein